MMGPSSHHDSSTHSRKKLKLSDEGRENRSPGGYKTRRSFSRRKRYTPHKTPEEILQNVAVSLSVCVCAAAMLFFQASYVLYTNL